MLFFCTMKIQFLEKILTSTKPTKTLKIFILNVLIFLERGDTGPSENKGVFRNKEIVNLDIMYSIFGSCSILCSPLYCTS